MDTLEIFIPTFNRLNKLKLCLESLNIALRKTSTKKRRKVGIIIRNNSVKKLKDYDYLIEIYKKKFVKLGLSYFQYQINGHNIGSTYNLVAGIINCRADYFWAIGDDDIFRFDSISTLINVIKKYSPCFIAGAAKKFFFIKKYNSNKFFDDLKSNKVMDVTYKNKFIHLFKDNLSIVDCTNFVYNTKLIKNFFFEDKNKDLINSMLPGTLAIFCLRSKMPFVRLERSLGIYRNGDNSIWRIRWLQYMFNTWPVLSNKFYLRKWLTRSEANVSAHFYRKYLLEYLNRIDIISGLNFKYGINPFLIFKYFRKDFYIFLSIGPVLTLKYFVKALLKKFFFKKI